MCQQACGGTPTNPLCVPHGSGDGGKVGGAIGRLLSIQIQGDTQVWGGSGGQYSVLRSTIRQEYKVTEEANPTVVSCHELSLIHTQLLVKVEQVKRQSLN